jgi:hypothetical protein
MMQMMAKGGCWDIMTAERRPFLVGQKGGLRCLVGSNTHAHLKGIFGTDLGWWITFPLK